MTNSVKSSLERLKDITNTRASGLKRKPETEASYAEDANPKDAKGGPGQGPTFGGEGFTEAQLKQPAQLIDSSVTSAVEKSVGSIEEDMVEMSAACVDAIEEQNSALASIKAEVSDMKTKTSDEHLTKETQRIIGSAAVRGSSAALLTTAQMGQENLFCGPRKGFPSYDRGRKTLSTLPTSWT